ncbi:hypothetical protein [Alicyclobacillus acidoterrestris]|uniref:Uncharacterized protein n=1 Tax=Alicyclobacillus acidoterrestris (strain ATCC 49025 / DSM 3922 / CIP 106132 / NCIMB 13137 / GD3B) TaxID=1356854 RepID=T0DDC3_ALIAG|nr:hypothetical protein [Alicyclobacillus acidoterrestris]EPZ47646.1 hypothetical protein N007_05155 [Alicyclobacillus acidoterrestris ATCC 49025]UNO48034.1 hypothetical protein K1I37_15275 [Alicyclobacillus acidoterrestris]
MGSHVHIDLYKNEITYDTVYPETSRGVGRLLKDLYAMRHGEMFNGDIDAVVMRLDLEEALHSTCMTPRQRQAIAFYYMAELNDEECARLSRISQQSFHERRQRALLHIAQYISNSDGSVKPQTIWNSDHVRNFGDEIEKWNQRVINNDDRWWEIDNSALSALAKYFPSVCGIERTDYDEESTYEYRLSDTSDTDWEVLMEKPEQCVLHSTRRRKRSAEYSGEDGGKRRRFYVHMPNDNNINKDKWHWTYNEVNPIIIIDEKTCKIDD